MGSTFTIVVSEDERTFETGERFYQFHLENSSHDDSLDELLEFKHFEENIEHDGMFMVYKKVPSRIVAAGEPSLADILLEYEDGDSVVRDPEGLDKFLESLEAARNTLHANGDLSSGRERTIELCCNLIKFAKKNGYGVSYE